MANNLTIVYRQDIKRDNLKKKEGMINLKLPKIDISYLFIKDERRARGIDFKDDIVAKVLEW